MELRGLWHPVDLGLVLVFCWREDGSGGLGSKIILRTPAPMGWSCRYLLDSKTMERHDTKTQFQCHCSHLAGLFRASTHTIPACHDVTVMKWPEVGRKGKEVELAIQSP